MGVLGAGKLAFNGGNPPRGEGLQGLLHKEITPQTGKTAVESKGMTCLFPHTYYSVSAQKVQHRFPNIQCMCLCSCSVFFFPLKTKTWQKHFLNFVHPSKCVLVKPNRYQVSIYCFINFRTKDLGGYSVEILSFHEWTIFESEPTNEMITAKAIRQNHNYGLFDEIKSKQISKQETKILSKCKISNIQGKDVASNPFHAMLCSM